MGLNAVIEHPAEGQTVLTLGTIFSITIGALWRLSDCDCIIVTSDDHGQWFGLPEPVDAPAKANSRLANTVLESMHIDQRTGDFELKFTGELTLEIISNSSGYESWVMSRSGEFLAAGANRGLV